MKLIRHDNITNRIWEDSGRHPKSQGARGRQVGLAGPTLALADAPLLGFWSPFWKASSTTYELSSWPLVKSV